jgi:TetR/AcrR family transcriptional regulator, cholesterol catabolism regulator
MRSDRTPYDDKLDSILSVAADLFATKGYHNTSIRDISRATNISLSGLYYYFASKEELLYLVQDHAFQLLGELEERLERVPEPLDRLKLLIRNQLTYFVSHMSAMKVLSHEAQSLTGEYYQRIYIKKKRLKDLAMKVLKELHPGAEFDPRVATFALFGMMNWLYTWYDPDRDVDVDTLVEQLTRLFLHGYLPRESRPDGSAASFGREVEMRGSDSVTAEARRDAEPL